VIEHRPDLVIMDIHMHKINVLEVIRRIHSSCPIERRCALQAHVADRMNDAGWCERTGGAGSSSQWRGKSGDCS